MIDVSAIQQEDITRATLAQLFGGGVWRGLSILKIVRDEQRVLVTFLASPVDDFHFVFIVWRTAFFEANSRQHDVIFR
jgi:hypothetical protein